MDAMGYQVVVTKRRGGAGEIGVSSCVHTTAVVSIPGMGDEVQAMKARLAGDRRRIHRHKAIGPVPTSWCDCWKTLSASGATRRTNGARRGLNRCPKKK